MFYIFVIVAALAALVDCYPSGTGIDSACSSMTPGHGVSPKDTTSPYYVYVDPAYYLPGQSVEVTIGSINSTFKGFMIQAKRAYSWEDQTELLGNFSVVSNTNAACNEHALVHSDSNSKSNLTFTWTPPSNSSGDIVFRVTFVQSKLVFWTNVESVTVYDVGRIQTTTMMASTFMTTQSGPSVIYKDTYCGRYIGCLSDCNIYGCDFFVSWYVNSNYGYVTYTLKSSYPAPGFYMAIGFSKDKEMGDDSVMGCVYQNGQVYKFTGVNEDHKGPALFDDYEVQLYSSSYSNDILTCIILRPIAGAGRRYDLNESWTLFFAKGVANVVNENIHVYNHEKDVRVSKSMVSAYSVVDLEPMEGDPDDDVNADSADSLMQTGNVKIILTFAFAIYYLAKKLF